MAGELEGGKNKLSSEYSIGVVSRLTGIAAGTLRMWERRYSVAAPRRGEKKNRQYSAQDIERLTLMKRLVDKGHAPSKIAKLTTDSMSELLTATQSLANKRTPQKAIDVIAVGERFMVEGNQLSGQLRAVRKHRSLDLLTQSREVAKADVLIMEIATLQPTSGEIIRELVTKCGALGAIVIFRISTQRTLSALENAGTVCLRDPVSIEHISRACQVMFNGTAGNNQMDPGYGGNTGNLFTPDQLRQIASLSPAIKCECPHHLADLITNLNAFEQYSAECINNSPEDRDLHEDLRVTSARSRALLEQALKRLMKAENIVITET